jgi:hypothetical protein
VVVPPSAEQEIYRLNNLASRLLELFTAVDPADPDDDDIEELAPEAQRLVNGHYLLDEFIDGFYEATCGLPARVRVRRPSDSGTTASRGRPSLLAMKRAWSADWTFEAIWSRLSGGGSLLPDARPVLLHAAALEPLPWEMHADAKALLGREVVLLGGVGAGIVAVREALP